MRLTVVPSIEIHSGRMLPLLRRVAFCRLRVNSVLRPLAYHFNALVTDKLHNRFSVSHLSRSWSFWVKEEECSPNTATS